MLFKPCVFLFVARNTACGTGYTGGKYILLISAKMLFIAKFSRSPMITPVWPYVAVNSFCNCVSGKAEMR